MDEIIKQQEFHSAWRKTHYRNTQAGIGPNRVGYFEDSPTRLAILDGELRERLLPFFINDQATDFCTLRMLEEPARTTCDLYIVAGATSHERHDRTCYFDFNQVEAYCTILNTYTGCGVRIIPLFESNQYTVVFMEYCKHELIRPSDLGQQTVAIRSYMDMGSFTVTRFWDQNFMYAIQHWLAYATMPEQEPPPTRMH